VKIGQSVAELSRFFRDFQDGGCRRLGFSKIGNFKSVTCGGGNMHHCAKFHQNPSNRCIDYCKKNLTV